MLKNTIDGASVAGLPTAHLHERINERSVVPVHWTLATVLFDPPVEEFAMNSRRA